MADQVKERAETWSGCMGEDEGAIMAPSSLPWLSHGNDNGLRGKVLLPLSHSVTLLTRDTLARAAQ